MNSRNSNKSQFKNNSTLEKTKLINSNVSLKSTTVQQTKHESRQSNKSNDIEVEIDTTYKKPLIFFLDLKHIQSDNGSYQNNSNSSIFSSNKKQSQEEIKKSTMTLKQNEQQCATSILESPSPSFVLSIHSKDEFDKNHLNIEDMRSVNVNDIPTISRSILTQKSPSPTKVTHSKKSFGVQVESVEWKKSSVRQMETRSEAITQNETKSRSWKSIGVSAIIKEPEVIDKATQIDESLQNELKKNAQTNTDSVIPDIPKQLPSTTFIAKASKAVKVVTDLKSRNIIIREIGEESTLKKLFRTTTSKESDVKHETLNNKLTVVESNKVNEQENLELPIQYEKQYKSALNLKSNSKNSILQTSFVELPDIKKRHLWWNVSPSKKQVPKSEKLVWKSLTRIDSGFIYK